MINYFFRYNLFDTYYPFTMLNSHIFTKMNQCCPKRFSIKTKKRK